MNVMQEPRVIIPVIDIDAIGLNTNPENIKQDEFEAVGKQLANGLGDVGFCYLQNCGIDEDLIERYKLISQTFFQLPIEEKEKYATTVGVNGRCFGYGGVGGERINPRKPGDLKEFFNYIPTEDTDDWPLHLKEFQRINKLVFEKCKLLAMRLCDALALVLGLEIDYMKAAHSRIGMDGNQTMLRILRYPPISPKTTISPGQLRLGEHTDFGTITLLFQDEIGGLEVNAAGKGYIPATPIPGTVLVNIGDMLQRLSSDVLVATKHRVGLPQDPTRRQSVRQSVAFFVRTNNDHVIKSLDGSNKYEPTNVFDHINKELTGVYIY